MAGRTRVGGGFALESADRERLRFRAVAAVRRARRHGEALAAITIALPAGSDPTAIAPIPRSNWASTKGPVGDAGCDVAVAPVTPG